MDNRGEEDLEEFWVLGKRKTRDGEGRGKICEIIAEIFEKVIMELDRACRLTEGQLKVLEKYGIAYNPTNVIKKTIEKDSTHEHLLNPISSKNNKPNQIVRDQNEKLLSSENSDLSDFPAPFSYPNTSLTDKFAGQTPESYTLKPLHSSFSVKKAMIFRRDNNLPFPP